MNIGLIGDGMILAALSWAATSNLTKMFLIDGTRLLRSGDSDLVFSLTGWIMLTPWMIVESGVLPISHSQYWSGQLWHTLGIISTVLAYVWFARGN